MELQSRPVCIRGSLSLLHGAGAVKERSVRVSVCGGNNVSEFCWTEDLMMGLTFLVEVMGPQFVCTVIEGVELMGCVSLTTSVLSLTFA